MHSSLQKRIRVKRGTSGEKLEVSFARPSGALGSNLSETCSCVGVRLLAAGYFSPPFQGGGRLLRWKVAGLLDHSGE